MLFTHRVTPIIIFLTIFALPKAQADFVNVNRAASWEIAHALQISQKLAESIAMHCEYITCRNRWDLAKAPGMTLKILRRVHRDILYCLVC